MNDAEMLRKICHGLLRRSLNLKVKFPVESTKNNEFIEIDMKEVAV